MIHPSAIMKPPIADEGDALQREVMARGGYSSYYRNGYVADTRKLAEKLITDTDYYLDNIRKHSVQKNPQAGEVQFIQGNIVYLSKIGLWAYVILSGISE